MKDRKRGDAMFGAIYGDVIGSYYEVHCTKAYDFPLMAESSFTDDSVLIAAVCRAILDDPQPISRFGLGKRARVYAAKYRQYYAYFLHAGFGNLFAAWASRPGAGNGRSYGNGAAMRVIPIGYAYDTMEQTLLQAKASCLPTHNNREAIAGAQAVAAAVYLARHGADKAEIRSFVEKHFHYDLSPTLAAIRPSYVFDSRASYSVPPALIAFLESSDYESAVRGAISLGGDADTQACIAGGIAEAYYGEIPDSIRQFCSMKIDFSIKGAVRDFCAAYKL